MTTYTSPYTGQTISPSQVGYESLQISVDTPLQWPINGNTTDVVANIIEVISTVSGLKLIMPPATEISTGQSALIRNIGSHPFTVTDVSLNTIITIPSGVAMYVYVTDNTTIDGVWQTVQFGSGTSSADAATLAGYGLKAIDTTLNTNTVVTQVSSNYTFNATDRASLYVWTGGAGSFTLPTAQSVGAGWFVAVKNDGSGILNVNATGINYIDITNTTVQLQIQDSFIICSDGTNWFTYGFGQSAQFFFTLLYLTGTGGTTTLTSAQAQKIIQEYSGTLTSNWTIVMPQTVQMYSLRNNTTGPYTLTFTTGVLGAETIQLAQNQTVLAICDGTNLYNAQTATSSSIVALVLGNGSATNPSLSFQGDPSTGLYLAASNQLGFAINGSQAARLTANGLFMPVGINGGAF